MDILSVFLLVGLVVFAALYFHVRADVSAAARKQYDHWRSTDRSEIVLEQQNVARREAEAEFAKWRAERDVELNSWKAENEASIRQDAIARSKAVIVGKVTEHVAPLLPIFPYNPKDARFVGSPIDMIVFDGCDDDDLRRIIFLEVKSGAANLTKRQRQIRDAIEAGKVEWQELKVPVSQGNSVAEISTPMLPSGSPE